MTIARELVALLERATSPEPPPRVLALHLPTVFGAASKDGEFCALELDDGSLGLSYVLLDDTLKRLVDGAGRERLAGSGALSVARWFAEESGVKRTIGFAAVNALTRSLFARTSYQPDWASDSIGLLDPQPADHIGMIGFFPSLAARIARVGAKLTVVELRPELAGERDGYRVTLDAAELHRCNKVLSTSTVLLNDTLDRMLEICRHASYFAMIGPGAGCLPDPLFARGVTLLGGTWITDRAGFAAALAAGTPWGRHARKFTIRREHYPGIDTLLRGGPALQPRGQSEASA